MRLKFGIMLAALLAGAACGTASQSQTAQRAPALAEARKAHVTQLQARTHSGDPVPVPPKGELDVVRYVGPLGAMEAYLSRVPADGRKHPAIIWISGGDCNTIGDFWSRRDPEDDQTAAQFREAGVVTMYPALRGGNRNPGYREANYGEVDDILAAADFLAKQPGIDPARIYLAGHSTGGTLVMLVAEVDSRFRATFAFGPVIDVSEYGEVFPLPVTGATETRLRSPGYWLDSIRSPVFVFEGALRPSNIDDLEEMQSGNTNPLARFLRVPGANHFSILAPATRLIAQRILADTGGETNIAFTQADLEALAPSN